MTYQLDFVSGRALHKSDGHYQQTLKLYLLFRYKFTGQKAFPLVIYFNKV